MSSYSEGQTHQLMESLEMAGYTSAHVTALGQNSNGALDQLMLVLTGVAKVVTDLVFRLVAKIDRDMTGWTCVELVEAEEEFKPTLHEFLREGENFVNGEEMVRRKGARRSYWFAPCRGNASESGKDSYRMAETLF